MFMIVSIQRWLEPRLAGSIRSSGMPMFKNTNINHFQRMQSFSAAEYTALAVGSSTYYTTS
jgi:hypothetical protein